MNKYILLPFRFNKIDNLYLLTNEVGEYVFLLKEEFQKLYSFNLEKTSDIFFDLKSKQIIADSEIDSILDMLAIKYRTKKSFLNDFTSLHMIVPTLACNGDCRYCQVNSKKKIENQYMMDINTAEKVVETIFKTPSNNIKIEIQGGEPLLNYEIVKYIINYATIINQIFHKNIEYVVCTNLTLIDKNILNFFKKRKVFISTSLDGPQDLHDKHRRLINLESSYELFLEKLKLYRTILGHEGISALMTTTRDSLSKYKEIIDEYINHGFNSIFLRILNPFGLASNNKELYYTVEEFFNFYRNSIDYIIKLNIDGYFFVEEYTCLILKKILTPFTTGFVDLQSPSGLGISGVIYNYDGNVYVSDEARMLAEMGDKQFLLGNVLNNSYEEIFKNNYLLELIEKSCLENIPMCCDCAYLPYCGIDPVRNYMEQGDILGNRAKSNMCQINKMIFEYIFKMIKKNDERVLDVFWSWITCRSLNQIELTN